MGLRSKTLLKEHGSPLFVISEQKIREKYREAKQAFSTRYPKVQFAWSYKTNYLNAVCNVFHQEGSWAEVVSGFEYDKAIANGVDSKYIIFNGPDKHEEDLRESNPERLPASHRSPGRTLHHHQNLRKKLKKRPRVAIRVNMDTGHLPDLGPVRVQL
ncbi:MAG: hypothetical protein MZV63_27190 [Marinilabiliales bacterium]|nr:hypothetical protein [Marinilabiliales bacterium]